MSKILVIDDEQPTLSMFKLFLSAYGYEVHTAGSGEEGLEAFAAQSPPIVLTDIKMPGMDGIEVLKRIKEHSPLTEVIVITGHGDMDLAIKALNLDATDFINKPIQREDLDKALARAEERIRLSSDNREQIAITHHDGYSAIKVRASLTSRSEAFLAEACREAADSHGLLLRFSDNASINGAGIAILTQLLLECRDKNIATAIAGLSDNFRKVFGIVGLTKLTTIYDSEDEAVAAVRSSNG